MDQLIKEVADLKNQVKQLRAANRVSWQAKESAAGIQLSGLTRAVKNGTIIGCFPVQVDTKTISLQLIVRGDSGVFEVIGPADVVKTED